MILVSTKQHQWVKYTRTPVTVLPNLEDDREIVVIELEADVTAAEENAVFGCENCGLPMPGNTDTMCKGGM